MTDSYHFESVAKFRVGGVYRCKDGRAVKIAHVVTDADKPFYENATAVRVEAHHSDGDWYAAGWRRLEDGQYHSRDFPSADLIPGELVQRDGEWVPAASIGPFPSGATLTTSGDKIVGRVESMTPTLDKLEASKDPQRAPLPHFNQRTPHDTFGPDFIVTKGAVEAPTTPSPTTDSAYPAIAGLLRVSDGGPANASASLLLKTA